MVALCLTAGLIAATLPLAEFTLAWTHSIEKVRWEEDYRLGDAGLMLVEARIRGAGAGMEPPAGAVLERGVWRYAPQRAAQGSLSLSHSPYAGDYEICTAGDCRRLSELLPGLAAIQTVTLFPCRP